MRSQRALAMVLAAGIVVGGCGGSARRSPRRPTSNFPVLQFAFRLHTRTPRAKPKPDPGSLPQTDQLPSANTAQFHAEMAALWSGVTRDSLRAAVPAFFPERGYLQVKAIADPQADYASRLLADYRLDLAAAHALLGSEPRAARLLNVEVPHAYAHWVSPGACFNRVGYYEVPNARVVYSLRGEVRSFGIASMISWRGVWYVVHLGSVVRSGAGGVVDDPTGGVGESIPSSTC